MEADVGKALSAILGELEQLRQQQTEVVHQLADRLDRLEQLAARQDGAAHHRQSSFLQDHWQALGGMPDMLAFAAPACRTSAVGTAGGSAGSGLRSNPWLPEAPAAPELLEEGGYRLKAGYPVADSEVQQQAPDLGRVESRNSLFRGHHAYSSNDLYRTSLLTKQCESADALERNNHSIAGAPDAPGAAAAAGGGKGVSAGAARMGVTVRASSDEEDGWDTLPEERPNRLARMGRALHGYLWGLLLPEQRAPWDAWIMLLIVWVVLATPIMVCFAPPETDPGLTAVEWIDLIVDLMFTADIWFNFRTAYISSEGRLVKDRFKIAKKYLSTWFIVDLLSVLPFTALFGAAGSNLVGLVKLARIARMGKVLRLLKGMRMVRLVKLPRLINSLEMKLDGAMVRVIAGVAVVLLVIHISGCLFFYMAVVEVDQQGPSTPTWVKVEGLQNATIPYQYLTSIYWAATTLTTVGYGDVHPVGAREKVLGMLVMVLGPFLAGYITSSISTVMNIRNTTSAHVAAKKQRARDFARHWALPKPLTLRLHNFFEYAAERDVARAETALLAELPLRMRLRLLGQLYAGLLVGIPAFRAAPIEFLQQLVGLMEVASYSKEDLVVLQGDPGGTLYFVAEGKLEVRQYEFDPVVDPEGLWQVASHGEDLAGHLYRLHGVLRERSFFGAVSAVCRCPWVATVVAVEGSQLYSLPWERMQVLFADWPEVAQAFYRTTIGPFWVQPSADDGSQGGSQPPPDGGGGGGGGAGASGIAADKAAVAGVLQPGSGGNASNLASAASGGGPVSLETRLLMWDFPMMVKVKRSKKKTAYGSLYKAASVLLHAAGLSSAPPPESPEPSMHPTSAHSKHWPYQQVRSGYSYSVQQQGVQVRQQQQQEGQELVNQANARSVTTPSSSSPWTADSAAAAAGAGSRPGSSPPPSSSPIKQAAVAGISGGLLKVPSAKGSLAAAAAAASAAAAAAASAAAATGGGEEADGEGVSITSRRSSSMRKSSSSQGAMPQQQEASSSTSGSSPPRSDSGGVPGGPVSRLANLARGMLGSRPSSSRHVTADLDDLPVPTPGVGRPVGPAVPAASAASEDSTAPPSTTGASGEAEADSAGPSRASASGVWLQSTGPSMYSSLGGNSFNIRSRGSSWGGSGCEEQGALSRSVSRSRSSTGARGMPAAPAPPIDYLDSLMSYPAAMEALPGGSVGPSMYSSAGRPTLEDARLRFRQLADRGSNGTTGSELLSGVMGAPAYLLSPTTAALQRGLPVDAGRTGTEALDTSLSSGGAASPLLGWPAGAYSPQQQQYRRSGSVQALGGSPTAGGGSAALLSAGSSRRWTMDRRQDS